MGIHHDAAVGGAGARFWAGDLGSGRRIRQGAGEPGVWRSETEKSGVRRSGVGEPGVRVERPPLRLTRRGRIVFTLLLITVAAMAVVLVAAPPGRAADPPAPRPTVVVGSGDTLWIIAERHLPRRDRFATIEEIRRLNRLDGYRVRAGQQLVLPRNR